MKTEHCESLRREVPRAVFRPALEVAATPANAGVARVRDAARHRGGEKPNQARVIRAADVAREAGAAFAGIGQARGDAA